MAQTVYVDARCLQDPEYRVRGIGQHLTSLLRTRTRSNLSSWKTVGLADPDAGALPAECASLFDAITFSTNPVFSGTPAVFLDGTPMTHDPRFSIRFVGHPSIVSAAVVYDFIPLDWPGYLPSVHQRIGYFAKLARLRNFDVLLPISDYTAWRLSELTGVGPEHVHVTGACVRRRLYELCSERISDGVATEDPYFVIVIAMDPRKNAEVPVEAVRRLNAICSRRIALKVVGHYQQHFKRHLLHLAGIAEGNGFLEFHPNIPDSELMRLYSSAVATIVPSHIEGFSLPAVEPTLCGCPVIVSSCAAHLELIDDPNAVFPSHDAATLAAKLETVLTNAPVRDSIITAQRHLGRKFHEDEVGRRFWSGIERALTERQSAFRGAKRHNPRIAFLSACRAGESDAAEFYTENLIHAGRHSFQADLYTDGSRPVVTYDSIGYAGNCSTASLLDGRYAAIVSVLTGTSSKEVFAFVERYGGPCILHDLRLVDAYRRNLGDEETLRFASETLQRPATIQDLTLPFHDVQDSLLLLDRVVARASPLIVQSKRQREIVRERYRFESHVATCCPSQVLSEAERNPEFRKGIRDGLGVNSDVFLISMFGPPSTWYGSEVAIMTIELLRSWNIRAELFLVGDPGDQVAHLNYLKNVFGVAEYVHCGVEFSPVSLYRNLLAASDACLQLRGFEFGKPSTHLCNAVTAGIPGVATEDMARGVDSPEYVFTVPDYYSPLLVAEQLATLHESTLDRKVIEEQRLQYAETHNFDRYRSHVMEILGLE